MPFTMLNEHTLFDRGNCSFAIAPANATAAAAALDPAAAVVYLFAGFPRLKNNTKNTQL